MARSLLILVPVSLREAGPCTVRRQKQQPACPFRARRHRGLRGPTNRPETIVSRHWWTATRPPTPVTTVARRSHPRRNAAPTTHRPLRTLDDRVTPRPPTRPREPIRAIATPPNNVPTPMPMPTPTRTRTRTRTQMGPSAPGRNPILRKQTTRNHPQSHLPTIVRQPIPKPTRPTRRNRTARQRRRRPRSRL